MVQTRLLVVGAGGHGRSMAEAAELSEQFKVVGFLDDSLPASETVLGRGAWMQAGAALGYGVRVAAGEVLLPGAARES